jgi:hypothetical protein
MELCTGGSPGVRLVFIFACVVAGLSFSIGGSQHWQWFLLSCVGPPLIRKPPGCENAIEVNKT